MIMEKFSSKNKYSPSADAALIEQIATNDQLPSSIQNLLQLADQFCNNNNSQQEVQVCGLTLLRMFTNVYHEFIYELQHGQVETLKRNILMRFGDCQLSKSTRRICGDIIRQLLWSMKLRHSYPEMNPTGHDINSLPWPQLFDQLLQVADDESQDANLRRMSLVLFAENMDTFYTFYRDIKFSDRHQRFVEIVKRWLNGAKYEFAIAAAECSWKSFSWLQEDLGRLSHPHAAIILSAFGDIVPLLLIAYRNTCDVDEYDAEKQALFAEHIESFFCTKNSHLLFQDPNQYQHLCDVFMPICRRNAGRNMEVVDVLCSIILNLMELNPTIHEFIATTPGEITKLFSFFVDLMCRWLEVEYDAEEWPHSFRPLSEDGNDLEEMCGFNRVLDFVYDLTRIFDGKEVSTLMAQMLERILESHNNNNSNNNNNDAILSASHKIPFNSAVSTFQQNSLLLNNKYPQWMISSSVLWCLGKADLALVDRLQKYLYSFLNTFVLPAAENHDHPFVRYSALYSVWRLHWRNMLPTDTNEARSIRKRFLEKLATKLHAAQDCFRVQEFAGVAIDHVFVESVDSDSTDDTAENISNAKQISIPNLLVQSIFDSLSNHESKPNFVNSSHLRALADVCDMISSDHPLNFNDQLLPLLQHLVQKYHSILLQEIESSSNINNNNNNDEEEESEFSRKARLNPSFKFDLSCLINSIRAATRVFKFLPASEENQTVMKELSSFVIQMLETLQLRVKDRILVDLIYALQFLCTKLGKNNFPNDCGGADLVDRMMPPLIHYAMCDHTIRKKEGIAGGVSDDIVKVKQAAVDIICRLCSERRELMKQKWTSSIGDIIIHLLETEGKSVDKMHKIGYDLFVTIGKTIGHPTALHESGWLQKLARKKFVGSNTNDDNNKNDDAQATNDEKPKPDLEEWRFLTKVANRVVLRFLGLKKVLDFENNFPAEPGIMNIQEWTNFIDSNLPNSTPIVIACLLPHISPSIWEHFAVLILYQVIEMVENVSLSASNTTELESEYQIVMKKATKLQARRQQREQRTQQELLLESGNRRQRQSDSDDAETRNEEALLHEMKENQLDEDVVVQQLMYAKQRYINNGNDNVSFDESVRAVRKCLKIALAGIPASRVTDLWNNDKFKDRFKKLIHIRFGRLLGLPLRDWQSYFDDYYEFAERFLAEDAERGRMKNNNNGTSNSSLPVPLPLKTRLELIMPMEPSLDLSLVLSQTTQVPRMMKSVLESDFFNALFHLSGPSDSDTSGMTSFILSCVDSSLTKIVSLIRRFKFVPLPEHSGANAVSFVLDRNAELSLELDKLLYVVSKFLEFFMRNLESICKSKDFLLLLAKALCARYAQNVQLGSLELFVKGKPRFLVKMCVVLHSITAIGVVEGLLNLLPKEVTEGKAMLSENTVHFTESYLSFNIRAVVNLVLEPVRNFVAEEAGNDEGATDDEPNEPLRLVDANAGMLLQTLTKYEILFLQYQHQQQSASTTENQKNENDRKEEQNDHDDNDNDAAEKSENTEPPKLWITGVIEEIKKIMSGIKKEQVTSDDEE